MKGIAAAGTGEAGKVRPFHFRGHMLNADERFRVIEGDALAVLPTLADGCMSLVFFSPPYSDQRTYGIDFNKRGQVWVDWLRCVIIECARVSSGLVVINAAGPVEDRSYQPIMEWLVADLTRLDGIVCGPSPYAWVKSNNHEDADANGLFGSGGTQYQRRDWEPLYTFCRPDRLPLAWTDNTAFGHPPKWGPGGKPSMRRADGSRANDPWKTASRGGGGVGGRHQNGKRKAGVPSGRPGCQTGPTGQIVPRPGQATIPELSNAGNVIKSPVGGGKLGHAMAHDNEAPMSIGVSERLIAWFVPPDGIVCDPFVGSGTTLHAAMNLGRRGIGIDIRADQVALSRKRLATVTPCIPGFA